MVSCEPTQCDVVHLGPTQQPIDLAKLYKADCGETNTQHAVNHEHICVGQYHEVSSRRKGQCNDQANVTDEGAEIVLPI